MGSALSRRLFSCCPGVGAAGLALLSRWRGSRWGSSRRDSCASASAFAGVGVGGGGGSGCGGGGGGGSEQTGNDAFLPLKANNPRQRPPTAEKAGLVTDETNNGGRRGQPQRPAHGYGSTNPVAVTTEDEVDTAGCSLSRKSSAKSVDKRQQPTVAAAAAAAVDSRQTPTPPPPPLDSAELQLQQQQLQELQRMKLESQFPNRSLGQVHFVLQYLIAKSALYIRIIKGSSLTAQDSNGLSDPYVKIHLLPDTGKGTKLRTRTCQRTLNPTWDEEFCYSGVLPADLERKNIRLTVLDEDTIGFDWMGEAVFPLKQLAQGRKEYYEVFLQPKNEELERSLASQAGDRGKILIGLYYAPAKGELTVKVIQCVNLLAMDPNGYSDPFVKLFLKPDRNRGGKFKTEVKRKTLNPEFKEDFVFSVSPQDLPTKTLEITVWDKDFGTKNDFIGALMLGNKCSGERWTHWDALLKQPYLTHTKWHPLGVELQPQH